MHLSWWIALLSGIGVAAACGLRAFLPLLAVGLAGRFGLLELKPGAEWLSGDLALICLGAATVVEIVGDKVPVVDHALDAIGTVLRPLAAWIGAYAVLIHWPAPWAQIAALVLGGAALTMHAVKAKLRLGSTAVTLGLGNTLLSGVEDVIVLLLLAAAVLVPIAVLLLVIAAVALGRRMARRPAPTRAIESRVPPAG